MKREELEALSAGCQSSVVVLVANQLGILRRLCQARAGVAGLAETLGLGERGTEALCDALVSLGVLRRIGAELEVVEELRPVLDPTSPHSMSAILDHHWHILQRWARLEDVVRSGQPVPRPPQDPAQLTAFILGMADIARRESEPLWAAADLAGRRHLIDVGGGPGELALAALERWPELRASILDRPGVLEIARAYGAGRGVGDRLDFIPGDALEGAIPPCDVALVSAVVHSYGPEDVALLGRNVAAGLEPGGLLIVREFMWDDRTHSGPAMAGLFAVNMLVGTSGGRCYAPEELQDLLGPAGFGEWRTVRIDPRSTILLGTRVG
jgi:SAM-dependent methyltransferase